MPLATLPDSSVQAPIVAVSPRVEAVADPNAMAQVLAAYGNGQAVVQRAGQDSLASSQALNQMANANTAVDIQAREAEQNMALRQAQFEEFMSPEQQQARRGAAIVQALQAKEAEESAPERQLLDHYTRRAAISAAIAAPGNYDKKIQAILLHGGDTSGYDPESLLPIDPKVKQKIDDQFQQVMEYDQWRARMEALEKDSKQKQITFTDGETGKTVQKTFWETPDGLLTNQEYQTLRRGSGMSFRQWMASPDAKEKPVISADDLAKKLGTVKPGSVEVSDSEGEMVTQTERKPASLGEDTSRKLAALQSTVPLLVSIKQAYEAYDKARSAPDWLKPVTGRAANLNPYDKPAAVLEAAVNAAVPLFARGVFGEVGVLSDKDILRYRGQFPTASTPKPVAEALLRKLESVAREQAISFIIQNPKAPQAKALADTFQLDATKLGVQEDLRGEEVKGWPSILETKSAVTAPSAPVARTAAGEAVYRDPDTGAYYKLPAVMPR